MSANATAGEAAEDLRGTWRLPRGATRLPRDVISYNQRLRLVAGVARALSHHGYASLSVEQIVEQAGVSRSTFYENFGNKHDCVLAAHRIVFDCLVSEISKVCAVVPDWPGKVRAAVITAIEFVAEAPDEARLLSLDVVGADPAVASEVVVSSERLAAMLHTGRQYYPEAEGLPDLTEMALVSAVSSLLSRVFIDGEADRVEELTPQIVQLLLMPYVGAGEAQRLALAA
jgi:AcrR family transcriptional regulator